MSLRKTAQIVTALSLQGNWVKILQARIPEQGPAVLLGMKARQVTGLTDEETALALQELAASLPAPARDVMGLLSTSEIFTRYLALPSEKPEELKAMALYQLEGVLPFPIQDCVTAVKILGPAGEATRVLVAAAHRPRVERLIRICRQAGLQLWTIALAGEAIGQWHRACWPEGRGEASSSRSRWPIDLGAAPKVWLVAEFTPEGLDLGVLIAGSLVYLRQIPHPSGDPEEFAAHLQETIRAYQRERIGPLVEQVTVSGWLEGLGSVPLEHLERGLNLPVRRVDPLEASPFRESLAVTAQGLSPEVSFSELLGAACAPKLLELDLLPVEIRQERERRLFLRQLRRSAWLISIAVVLAVGWIGAKIGGTTSRLREAQAQIRQMEPQVDRVRRTAAAIRAVAESRRAYAAQIQALSDAAGPLPPGITFQFIGLEAADRTLLARGAASDFDLLNRYCAALREQGFWESVNLRSAKRRAGEALAPVEFELILKAGERGNR